jgi:hypothetical protein
VTEASATSSNADYLEGLRQTDNAATVEALYAACRKPVARAVEAAGGSNADGNTFFRVALLQTAGMAQQLPDTLPVLYSCRLVTLYWSLGLVGCNQTYTFVIDSCGEK